MYKLNYAKRLWIVKQYGKGVSTSKIAMTQKINRRAVYQIIDKFKEFCLDGLKDHKTGRPETQLNHRAEIIMDLRRRFGHSACLIERLLKNKGFSISHRQIEKLLIRQRLVIPNVKKQKPQKMSAL